MLSKPKINIKKGKKINKTILEAINLVYNKNFQLSDYDINRIERKFFDESIKLLPKKTTWDFRLLKVMFTEKKNGL